MTVTDSATVSSQSDDADNMRRMLSMLVDKAQEANAIFQKEQKREKLGLEKVKRETHNSLVKALDEKSILDVQVILEDVEEGVLPGWLERKARDWYAETTFQRMQIKVVSQRLRRMLSQSASDILVCPRRRRFLESDVRAALQLPEIDPNLVQHAQEYLTYLSESDQAQKKIQLDTARAMAEKKIPDVSTTAQLHLAPRLQKKVDRANLRQKKLINMAIEEANSLESAMDSGDRQRLAKAIRSARIFVDTHPSEEMFDLIADASDILEDLTQEDSTGRLAVSRYKHFVYFTCELQKMFPSIFPRVRASATVLVLKHCSTRSDSSRGTVLIVLKQSMLHAIVKHFSRVTFFISILSSGIARRKRSARRNVLKSGGISQNQLEYRQRGWHFLVAWIVVTQLPWRRLNVKIRRKISGQYLCKGSKMLTTMRRI